MKILLTGKNGQVGWELQRTLAPLGDVVAVDRQALDLTSPDAIRALIREVKPNLIVNPAAYTAVDQAESEPEVAMAVNGTAPAIMAEEAKKLGAAMVHYSTDYVFDGSKATPYNELDATSPINVYGRTKLAGEQAVQATGIPHLILRTSWVYGNRGKNFLLTILRLAGERDELKIVDDQIGAPTSSRMIAEITGQILAQCFSPIPHSPSLIDQYSGLYHLTAAGQTSWHGFSAAILENRVRLTGAPAPQLSQIQTSDYPLPAPRPHYSVMSNNELKHAFGVAIPTWRNGLDLCMEEM
ncbi:MAG: dTDP-4-dehydrorhamnose reductase [Gammaproteobacteria bacterium]|nr:dTDP-4-dehydrorhamnose reductase [Gammaproteobacteria bacterium]MBU1732919.1 dTDP-4-dehydrorhamnose reductase [Gammaproteobacteria bacterium]MBU1891967.1 dTDP-4-dehydrorhamnose reductase [Gammaproteobacteria bacterium]